MELVDGDSKSPTLISNVEVMQLLKKNIDQRAKSSSKKKNNKRNKLQFRHRDWVEEEVHRYLQSAPCVKLDPEKREEFHSKLKGNKKLRRAGKSATTEAASVLAAMKGDTSPSRGDKAQPAAKSSTSTGFDLTEAEALQIMNMMPSEPVEIHLMVDELQSRMSETRQEEFLAFIESYSTGNSTSATQMEVDEVPRGIVVNGQHENGKLPAVNVKQEITEDSSNNVI